MRPRLAGRRLPFGSLLLPPSSLLPAVPLSLLAALPLLLWLLLPSVAARRRIPWLLAAGSQGQR
eukprot:2276364-Rhodomonas_salina.1